MATSKAHESFGLDKVNRFSLKNKTREEVMSIIDCLREEGASPVFSSEGTTFNDFVDNLLSEGFCIVNEGNKWYIDRDSSSMFIGRDIITL